MPKALEQSTPRWTTFSFFLLEHFCDLLENYVHPLVTHVFRSLVGTALSEPGFWWHKDSASQQNTSSGSRVLSKEAIKFAGWDLELIWCHHGFLPVQALNRLWTGSFRLLQATSGSFRLLQAWQIGISGSWASATSLGSQGCQGWKHLGSTTEIGQTSVAAETSRSWFFVRC